MLIDLVTVDTLDESEVPCGSEERVALNEVVQGRECSNLVRPPAGHHGAVG
ncbi:hypothetical protein P6B95_41885 [Streptomyces atratus]|uniref:hypothetical protein n=1 Tax=Streptomyces atratus TaxID=1893 RepID=UPI001670AE70|nr:hypothetical protein [Streptomyces atratus]WPW33260.1 hypothetical protein P6B95_41885 [Streptomyces atratus]